MIERWRGRHELICPEVGIMLSTAGSNVGRFSETRAVSTLGESASQLRLVHGFEDEFEFEFEDD